MMENHAENKQRRSGQYPGEAFLMVMFVTMFFLSMVVMTALAFVIMLMVVSTAAFMTVVMVMPTAAFVIMLMVMPATAFMTVVMVMPTAAFVIMLMVVSTAAFVIMLMMVPAAAFVVMMVFSMILFWSMISGMDLHLPFDSSGDTGQLPDQTVRVLRRQPKLPGCERDGGFLHLGMGIEFSLDLGRTVGAVQILNDIYISGHNITPFISIYEQSLMCLK